MKTLPLLALDTDVLTYLTTTSPKEGQEGKWQESRRLLAIDDWEICIPAPALGEVLAWIPQEKREETGRRLQSMFRVLTFDGEAAQEMGRLTGPALRWPRDDRPRQGVKFDIQIVACAIRHRATAICVYDGHHSSLADRLSLAIRVGPPSAFLLGQQGIPFPGRSPST